MQKNECWRQERWTLKKCRCAQILQLHLAPVYCAHMLILHPFEQIFVLTNILLNKYSFEQIFFWTNILLNKCPFEKMFYWTNFVFPLRSTKLHQTMVFMHGWVFDIFDISKEEKNVFFTEEQPQKWADHWITQPLANLLWNDKKWSWSWLFIEQCSITIITKLKVEQIKELRAMATVVPLKVNIAIKKCKAHLIV